jgi:hypothetical protein
MTETEKPPSLETVRQLLRDLPNAQNTRKSRQGMIRALLPEIESAIEQGVPRTTIVEQLNKMGIEISLPIFATSLHRARAARDKKKGGRQPSVVQNGKLADSDAPSNQQETATHQKLTRKQIADSVGDQFVNDNSLSSNPILQRLREKEQKDKDKK